MYLRARLQQKSAPTGAFLRPSIRAVIFRFAAPCGNGRMRQTILTRVKVDHEQTRFTDVFFDPQEIR